MLHKETISRGTLDLLKQLQNKEYLKGFYLAGGTALALQIGHRTSVDIDLFSDFSFNTAYVLENLTNDFGFNLFFSSINTLRGSIKDVQVDIMAHRYPLIFTPVLLDNISLLSTEDIIAMKLNAITTNGQRVKDFIDIYFLLKKYTLAEMIGFYKRKYADYNEVNVLKSLTWYEDVDLSGWPVLLQNPELKWQEITKKLINDTRKYLSV